MGICECEIHGWSGLLDVCEHLEQQMVTNTNPEKVFSLLCYFGDFAGNKDCPIWIVIIYCLVCSEKYELPKQDTLEYDTEDEPAKNYFSEFTENHSEVIKGVCGKCFDEFLDKHNVTLNLLYPQV